MGEDLERSPGDNDQPDELVAGLKAEVARLRAEVARLKAKNAELIQAAADRDFERPPHYR